MTKVRTDKWLWAARFFKTRAKCREAIDGGKVHVNGVRVKPGREMKLQDELVIRQGFDEKTIIVKGLSGQRRGASDAQLLYEETAESIAKRELLAAQRKAAGPQGLAERRPSKKDRRLIHKFRQDNLGNG